MKGEKKKSKGKRRKLSAAGWKNEILRNTQRQFFIKLRYQFWF
jgi:hypothetical protein